MPILDTLLLHPARSPARPRLPAMLARLGEMWRTAESRRHLARLDDRMLKDIGLSRADALAEAARPPWDLDRR